MKENNLKDAISKIKLLVSDVDGVLTDGKVLINSNKIEGKFFNVEDGTGSALAYYAKLPIALISGRYSKSTEIRAKELKIQHCLYTLNKKLALKELAKIYSVSFNEIAYIGDSLVDLPVLSIVGLPITVNNGHILCKKDAIWITKKNGGEGVILEVVERILIEQNIYKKTINKMKKDKFDENS